jgi:hypothetical protein
MESITSAALLVAAVAVGGVAMYRYNTADEYDNGNLMKKGMNKPVLWIYLNNSDVNSRSWADFMARSSRVMNLPFLNLCYDTAVNQNSDIYRIEVIGGLEDLAVRLGGWDELPTPLRTPGAVVREPELNWIRAAVLAKWGGLWVSPATVWIAPIGPLPKKSVVFFGTDPAPAYVTSDVIPALNVIWSPVPAHPVWVSWENAAWDRLERRSGGSEFRHDEKSDLADAMRNFSSDIQIYSTAELSRKGAAMKRVELEDLLAAGTEGNLPFAVNVNTKFVPIPYPEIIERKAFEWFLRMSEEQVLESDLVISYLLKVGRT